MRAALRIFPLTLVCLLVPSLGVAQAPPPPRPQMPIPIGPGNRLPLPPNFNPLTGRPGQGVDCAVAAMDMEVHQRREDATVDVGVRVRGVKGGPCVVRPDAVQITTTRSSGTTRLLSFAVVDGQTQKTMAVLDAPAGDRLRPWTATLQPNEEHVVTFRFLVEGDVLPTGEIDPPSRARVDLRSLGPRVLNGAPFQTKVSLESGAKGRVTLNTGNPKAPGSPRPLGADGTLSSSIALSRDDLLPLLEWRFDGDLPAEAASSKLSEGGLAELEYLRVGLVRDLSASLADAKDEKKVKQGWDEAFDAAIAACRSSDPFVAGLGARTVAWLGSGLAATSTTVRSADEGAGDGPVVSAKVAAEVSRATTAFQAATGQKIGPTPANVRPARPYLSKLGEPGSHKKEAEDALKRLSARLDDNKVTATAGDVQAKMPLAAVPAAPANLKTAKVIMWGPRGAQFVTEGHPPAIKAPLVQRIVRGMSHRKPLMAGFLGLTALGGLGYGIMYFLQKRREQEGTDEAPKSPATA